MNNYDEVIVLMAIVDLIDKMVNKDMLWVSKGEFDTILPTTSGKDELFAIYLADLLSTPGNLITTTQANYLKALKSALEAPLFDIHRVEKVKVELEKFIKWLEEEVVFKDVNLHVNEQINELRISRMDHFLICGNTAKHNITRLDGMMKKIRSILKKQGVHLTELEAYQVLEEYNYNLISTGNYFGLYITALATLLNDLRLSIYDYLTDELLSVLKRTQQGYYRIEVPSRMLGCKVWYWELMEWRRRQPIYSRSFNIMPNYYHPYNEKQSMDK